MASGEWTVQIYARVSAYRALIPYIILFPLCLQLVRLVQLAGSMFGKRWDLGSIPRSPYNFHTIFLIAFICRFSKEEHYRPHIPTSQVSSKADPGDKKKEHHGLESSML